MRSPYHPLRFVEPRSVGVISPLGRLTANPIAVGFLNTLMAFACQRAGRCTRCPADVNHGKHAANAAAWTGYVAPMPRNEMQMAVQDGLTGHAAHIYVAVVPGGQPFCRNRHDKTAGDT